MQNPSSMSPTPTPTTIEVQLPNISITILPQNTSSHSVSPLSLTAKTALGVGIPFAFGLCVVVVLILSGLLRLHLLRQEGRAQDQSCINIKKSHRGSKRREELFLPDAITSPTATGAKEILGSPIAELDEVQASCRVEEVEGCGSELDRCVGPFELDGQPVANTQDVNGLPAPASTTGQDVVEGRRPSDQGNGV